ncbi:MAG: DUF1998 domain-containing protein [Bryobacteraceae bacterium]|nr:DUF1998 domain-containing protein [Bryobacteraceae bacterium]
MTASQTKPVRVGELRPSQLLLSYGIGALADLPNISAIITGLEDWPVQQGVLLTEERLLASIREELGSQVQELVAPPPAPDVPLGTLPDDSVNLVGVPVAAFPRWLICPQCRLLAPISSGLFELAPDLFRPERAHYRHRNCYAKRAGPAIPIRFLVACSRGHLDDFPWVDYSHRGQPCASPELKFLEQGSGDEPAQLAVVCTQCPASRSRAEALDRSGPYVIGCAGRRPHLRDYDATGCQERMRTITLGASNTWFASLLSALTLPKKGDRLAQLVEEYWALLNQAQSAVFITAFRAAKQLNAFVQHTDEQIWNAIEARRSGTTPEAGDLKTPEYGSLSNPATAPRSTDFRIHEVAVPPAHRRWLERVVLADRLREVRALIGFTRIESSGELDDPNLARARRAPISRTPPKWVPATEIRGEGLFLQFREEEIANWASQHADRSAEFFKAHRQWRTLRKIPSPELGYPGLRFVLLHSFAHALIRQFALECGYAAASLRERIYSKNPGEDDGPMAGVLIYTAAPDSEGTLGGLVRLGEPEALGRHIRCALGAMQLCASDPLCAEHDPPQDGLTLHAAACHACLFSAETSCERGNRYLDRSVLVETVERPSLAFFKSAEVQGG